MLPPQIQLENPRMRKILPFTLTFHHLRTYQKPQSDRIPLAQLRVSPWKPIWGKKRLANSPTPAPTSAPRWRQKDHPKLQQFPRPWWCLNRLQKSPHGDHTVPFARRRSMKKTGMAMCRTNQECAPKYTATPTTKHSVPPATEQSTSWVTKLSAPPATECWVSPTTEHSAVIWCTRQICWTNSFEKRMEERTERLNKKYNLDYYSSSESDTDSKQDYRYEHKYETLIWTISIHEVTGKIIKIKVCSEHLKL